MLQIFKDRKPHPCFTCRALAEPKPVRAPTVSSQKSRQHQTKACDIAQTESPAPASPAKHRHLPLLLHCRTPANDFQQSSPICFRATNGHRPPPRAEQAPGHAHGLSVSHIPGRQAGVPCRQAADPPRASAGGDNGESLQLRDAHVQRT